MNIKWRKQVGAIISRSVYNYVFNYKNSISFQALWLTLICAPFLRLQLNMLFFQKNLYRCLMTNNAAIFVSKSAGFDAPCIYRVSLSITKKTCTNDSRQHETALILSGCRVERSNCKKYRSKYRVKYSKKFRDTGRQKVPWFFVFLFYLPYLSSIHEKANCIAILWTGSPHSLGSCLF